MAPLPKINQNEEPNFPSEPDIHGIGRAIDAATIQALANRRYPTAYALQTLWHAYCAEGWCVRLFEAVIYQTATPTEAQFLEDLITRKKEEGKRDGEAVRFFRECGALL